MGTLNNRLPYCNKDPKRDHNLPKCSLHDFLTVPFKRSCRASLQGSSLRVLLGFIGLERFLGRRVITCRNLELKVTYIALTRVFWGASMQTVHMFVWTPTGIGIAIGGVAV